MIADRTIFLTHILMLLIGALTFCSVRIVIKLTLINYRSFRLIFSQVEENLGPKLQEHQRKVHGN